MKIQLKEKAAQERAERQKMLKKGVDLLDGNEDFQIKGNKTAASCFNRLEKFIFALSEFITPLGERTKMIQIQQDKSVASLFVTFRFLIALSMIDILIFVPLFIRHQRTSKGSDYQTLCKTASGEFPCFLFYSSFD